MEEERRTEAALMATVAVAKAPATAVAAATAAALSAAASPALPRPPAVSKTSRGCCVRGGKHAAASAAVREAWLRLLAELPPPPPPPPSREKAPFFYTRGKFCSPF